MQKFPAACGVWRLCQELSAVCIMLVGVVCVQFYKIYDLYGIVAVNRSCQLSEHVAVYFIVLQFCFSSLSCSL